MAIGNLVGPGEVNPFIPCLAAAKQAAGGPFGVDAYKAACKVERAAYNAAKYNQPLFDMDHCGQFDNRQGDEKLTKLMTVPL